MKYKYIIHTQTKEWYGDENHVGDPNFGRFKNKGGMNFVIEGDESLLYGEEGEFLAKFNRQYDDSKRHMRYEAWSFEPYIPPYEAKLVDGEVII
jgi:hypothetical protein